MTDLAERRRYGRRWALRNPSLAVDRQIRGRAMTVSPTCRRCAVPMRSGKALVETFTPGALLVDYTLGAQVCQEVAALAWGNWISPRQ